jgi:hypothetical protein
MFEIRKAVRDLAAPWLEHRRVLDHALGQSLHFFVQLDILKCSQRREPQFAQRREYGFAVTDTGIRRVRRSTPELRCGFDSSANGPGRHLFIHCHCDEWDVVSHGDNFGCRPIAMEVRREVPTAPVLIPDSDRHCSSEDLGASPKQSCIPRNASARPSIRSRFACKARLKR